ncbi:cytosolic phospholipase A2 gamma [Pogona vitticeps]
MDNRIANGEALDLNKRDIIRISRDISDKEKAIIRTRQIKVHSCLQKLGANFPMSNVPNIAVLGSGGSLRAMIALQGVLGELQKQGLLDAVMYLCGVSGSTWCMSYIYEHEEWTEHLPVLEEKLCNKLVSTAWDPKKAVDALVESSKDHTFSLTDFWSSVVVYAMLHELDHHSLSEQRRVSIQGKVPYPIYAAVDSKKLDDDTKTRPDIWFEFTPDEAGFFHSGAFVDMRLFGSIFENGKLKTMKDEKSIAYLRGLWGSAFADFKVIEDFIKQISGNQATDSRCQHLPCQAASYIMQLLKHAIEEKSHEYCEKHLTGLMELLKDQDVNNTYNLCNYLKDKYGTVEKSETVTHVLTMAETFYWEFAAGKPLFTIHEEEDERSAWDTLRILKKTISCLREWKWGTNANYLYKCGGINDKGLTGTEELQLADAGLAINSAYPLVLRPEREVKLILSFDFSEGDPFETVKQAAIYCKKSQIPFPDIDVSELDKSKDSPSDCYIFQGSNTPIVMHFPLFNIVNCRDKVANWRDKYSTINLSYEEQEIKDLLEVAKGNVRNNAGRICQTMKNILPF